MPRTGLTRERRWAALALLALWVAAVAYVTLTPAGYSPSFRLRRFMCIACGELDGSDILRNWILFVPGGLLSALVLDRWKAIALPVGLTLVVEASQTWIPGRDPALQDLLLNTLGGVTGVFLMRRGLTPVRQRMIVSAAALAWLAPLALLVPGTTTYDLYGLWTPRFGRRAAYQGTILEASVGGLPVYAWMVEDKATLDAALRGREPIRLLFTAGGSTRSRDPIFQIVDRESHGVLELHALGPDLILRGWNPARVLLLDQPDTRWAGAMDGVAVGDTVTLVIDRSRDSTCMSIDDREQCNLAPSLADGWGHVLYLEGPPAWFRELMSLMWATGLGGLVGLVSGSRRSALVTALGVALVGYVAAHISPDVRPSALHGAVLVGGALAGAFLRGPVARLWSEVRPA